MKRTTLHSLAKGVIAGGLMLAATFASPVISTAQEAGSTVTVDATSLRLRGGASTTHATISVLDKGQVLKVVSTKDGWTQVELPSDAPCWIYATYVQNTGGGKGKVTGENVNLRLSADTNLYAIGQVSNISISFVLDSKGELIQENGFVKIVPPSEATGWVSSEYLTTGGSVATSDPEAAATPVEVARTDEHAKARPSSGESEARADAPDAPIEGKNLIGEAKAFRELDKTFLEELAKPTGERDFEQIKKLYEQYAEFAQDPTIRAKAKDRVGRIEKLEAVIQKVVGDAEAEADAKREAIDEQARAAEEKARAAAEAARKAAEAAEAEAQDAAKQDDSSEAVAYIAIGTVQSHGLRATHPASHAIKDSNGAVLYYVRWPLGNLDGYVGKQVGVAGIVEKHDGWDKPVIVITTCDLLQSNQVGEGEDK